MKSLKLQLDMVLNSKFLVKVPMFRYCDPRCLITLDPELDPSHSPNADRLGVTTELSYSTVAASLGPTDLDRLTSALEVALDSKRREREAADGRTIASYCLQYALLVALGSSGSEDA